MRLYFIRYKKLQAARSHRLDYRYAIINREPWKEHGTSTGGVYKYDTTVDTCIKPYYYRDVRLRSFFFDFTSSRSSTGTCTTVCSTSSCDELR